MPAAFSDRMRRLYVDGDADGHYMPFAKKKLADGRYGLVAGKDPRTASDHGHKVISALAMEAARTGMDRVAFHDLLLKGSGKGARHARDIAHRSGHDAAIIYIDRVRDRVREHLAARDGIDSRQDAHADLAALRARIERTPWKGTAGKTDFKNLSARLAVCEKAGGRRHTISERHLAEEAGCARETVRKSNERLEAQGFLRQLDSGSPTEAAAWLLLDGPVNAPSHGEATAQMPQAGGAMSGPEVRQPVSPAANLDSRTGARLAPEDAFAHLGLGGSGLAVVAALAEQDGQTRAELIGTATLSRATVYRQINKLAGLGLVRLEGELVHLTEQALDGIGATTADCETPVTSWEDAAQRLGTHGTAQRRRERHDVQRQAWQDEQQRLAERRRPGRHRTDPRRVPPAFTTVCGRPVDPATGEIIPGWRIATDGTWLWEPDPEEVTCLAA
ncbi:MarR family transcriptional regulator [Streptoverticillium reticulum]|uniref:MarR family transcriptional regulator n=1 Tax=Streptoverticillium reticulum TaxID=1433415 RepID=UPI0039BF3332